MRGAAAFLCAASRLKRQTRPPSRHRRPQPCRVRLSGGSAGRPARRRGARRPLQRLGRRPARARPPALRRRCRVAPWRGSSHPNWRRPRRRRRPLRRRAPSRSRRRRRPPRRARRRSHRLRHYGRPASDDDAAAPARDSSDNGGTAAAPEPNDASDGLVASRQQCRRAAPPPVPAPHRTSAGPSSRRRPALWPRQASDRALPPVRGVLALRGVARHAALILHLLPRARRRLRPMYSWAGPAPLWKGGVRRLHGQRREPGPEPVRFIASAMAARRSSASARCVARRWSGSAAARRSCRSAVGGPGHRAGARRGRLARARAGGAAAQSLATSLRGSARRARGRRRSRRRGAGSDS